MSDPVRIHLGHHFYGAGNLGDDFMLAGFLAGMRVAPDAAQFTCCIPFALEPQHRRFPEIEWLPCDPVTRARCIERSNTWLGLGGSPFQNTQSRWFIDHLKEEAAACLKASKPMLYLGIGVQTATELAEPDVVRVCRHASAIWTRDSASAERLRAITNAPPVHTATDLAHILFSNTAPPPAATGRCAVVANFDFGRWPGQAACLIALRGLSAREYLWLAQESRELPGAERALHAALPSAESARWQLVSPEQPGEPLPTILARWPSAEWLVTSRFHAAIAGAWAGSKVVVIAINEKLRGIAAELGLPSILPDADTKTVTAALVAARPAPRSVLAAASRTAQHAIEAWRAASTSEPRAHRAS